MAKGKCSTGTKWKDTFDAGCIRLVKGMSAGRNSSEERSENSVAGRNERNRPLHEGISCLLLSLEVLLKAFCTFQILKTVVYYWDGKRQV